LFYLYIRTDTAPNLQANILSFEVNTRYLVVNPLGRTALLPILLRHEDPQLGQSSSTPHGIRLADDLPKLKGLAKRAEANATG
jgi:hypothetical protein